MESIDPNRKELLLKVSLLPDSPGVYQYLNAEGTIIYIGKAKNLKRRVSSYFNKEHTDLKTRRLVAAIRDLRFIVVPTESDALLLENNLIKTYRPKYNILLKDDKSYPFIMLTKGDFPRIAVVRNIDRSKGIYFGPYTDVPKARKMVWLVRNLYKIRTCRLPLTEERIAAGKYSVCLQYHIKRCNAPCVGRITKEDYAEDIRKAKELIKGEIGKVYKEEIERMQLLAEAERYEEAEQAKRIAEFLRHYDAEETVIHNHYGELVVFGYEERGEKAYVNLLSVVNGAIRLVVTEQWHKQIEEEKEEVLATIITDMMERFGLQANEIILPFSIEWLENDKLSITIPQRGDKKRLLELSQSNVTAYIKEKEKQQDKLNPQQKVRRLLHQMEQDLGLKRAPQHIECFDNSNIMGTNPVSACTVFRDGKPSKREYRKFHVKQVIGANDYDTMKEVLTRRYKRTIAESNPLPDLIVIDGGKGQLKSALEALEALEIDTEKIDIIGLAERLEEVYKPHETLPLILPRDSETLRVLKHIRDEAHRFGITFHRSLRAKAQQKSALDNIPGIGNKRKELLLKKFGSITNIRKATLEELSDVIGKASAQNVKEYFEKEKKNSNDESSCSKSNGSIGND